MLCLRWRCAASCYGAVLCCAVLCCAVLCCAVLCCAVLCCAVLHRSLASLSHSVVFAFVATEYYACLLCVRVRAGEVSSVEMNAAGTLLLSSSKDNSHRLWDVRMMRPHLRLTLKGHQNTTKNFGRASFGPTHSVGADVAGSSGGREGLVVGGSEDGLVYLWDLGTGKLLSRLRGHSDVVYHAKWNEHKSLLATCSDDGTAMTWWYDEKRPWATDVDV
jgi:COMPASS component SWD3